MQQSPKKKDEGPSTEGAAPHGGQADPASADEPKAEPKPRLDPTRYGDWEKDGRCIDF